MAALAAFSTPAAALSGTTSGLVAAAAPVSMDPVCVSGGDVPDPVPVGPPVTACVDPEEPSAYACSEGYIRGVLGLPIIIGWQACAGANEEGPWHHCTVWGSFSHECPQL